MEGELREKCAIAGYCATDPEIPAAFVVRESLRNMQHRGQEASGIVSEVVEGQIRYIRGEGYVTSVFPDSTMDQLPGPVAIGHNRYSTNGTKNGHKQPVIERQKGFSLGLNGNNPTTEKLETSLKSHNITTSLLNDAEMMAYQIGQTLTQGHDLPSAIELNSRLGLFGGAYSCVSMHNGQIVAFRDPMGIRPLAIGSTEYGFATTSETVGLDIIGAEYLHDVEPGYMYVFDQSSSTEYDRIQIADVDGPQKLDIFEFVYFARPDSYLYGQRVHEVRKRFGRQLAKEQPVEVKDQDIENTLVIPVPDTSIPAAEAYAKELGLPFASQAIIKDRYSGRAFITPNGSSLRDLLLKRKHSFISEEIQGKDLVIIDDSIVRMDTAKKIVEEATKNGAKSVVFLSASPPVRFPDFYGIDTPSQKELAAANLKVEEMKQELGVKKLGFLSLKGMIDATGFSYEDFNLSPFNGEYPIDIGEHRSEIQTPVSMEYAE
ncbi:amidophosphoribosyltransferase [Candidatus Saccharibacteria bacterium]|nr:amidophosphoribosyltransferase [Candidatus Saccharibacteria bacterium]